MSLESEVAKFYPEVTPKYPDLRQLTTNQLVRLYYQIFKRIEKRYGPGAWDWPTLHAVFPEFYYPLKAIIAEGCRQMHS